MKRLVLLVVVAAFTLVLSSPALAETVGAGLAPDAVETDVWSVPYDVTQNTDGSQVWTHDVNTANWDELGTGVATATARSWNSGGAQGDCNKESWSFGFTNHASVAQWINWNITDNRKDWRIRKPGVYASDCITFTISSNNDVDVTFSDFGDLAYEDPDNVPAGTQGTIETWYGWGDNIAEAQTNGWVRADDLNGSHANFFPNTNALHYGLTYKLWSKIQVEPSNNSSDYENQGTVTLAVTNLKYWIDGDSGNFASDQTLPPTSL